MELWKRLALAAAVVVFDVVLFVVPLTALAIAYVIVARPRRFLEWMLRIYDDRAPGPDPGP